MLRETIVHECVVRGKEIQNVSILVHHAFEQHLRLTAETLSQRIVPVGIAGGNRRRRFQISQIEPLSREVVHQGFGSRIGEHAPNLLFEHRRIVEFSLARDVDQFVVGNAAPQEKRQPGGQFQIANAIRLADRQVGRFSFDTHQKLRACQDPPNGDLNTVFKRGALASFLIEPHQTFKVFGSCGTPISAPRQRRNDLLCASLFLGGLGRARGAACKHLAHAARVCRTLGSERTLNLQEANFRIVGEAGDPAVFERASRKVFGEIEAGPVVGGEERDADLVRTGFYGNRDLQASAGVAVGARVSAFEIVPVEELDSLAVDVEFELLVSYIRAENEFLQRELVLTV